MLRFNTNLLSLHRIICIVGFPTKKIGIVFLAFDFRFFLSGQFSTNLYSCLNQHLVVHLLPQLQPKLPRVTTAYLTATVFATLHTRIRVVTVVFASYRQTFISKIPPKNTKTIYNGILAVPTETIYQETVIDFNTYFCMFVIIVVYESINN